MNWEQVRDQFPVTKEYLYFDIANKCSLPLFSTDTVRDYIDEQQQSGGNKDKWFKTIADARGKMARLIGASTAEIGFTKNTSESLNLAANGLPLKPGDVVLLNGYEHPNNIYCWLNLERRGVGVKWLPSKDGAVTVEDIAAICEMTPKIKAIAIASTNYAPGNRHDLEAIGRFCREKGIYTVVDAVQSVGTVEIDVKKCNIDILCGSGHKYLFCPHGVGLLYCRHELIKDLVPFVAARSGMAMAAQIEKYEGIIYKLEFSGDCRQFEIGNYNYLGLTVLDKSLDFLLSIGMETVEQRILDLGDRLIVGLNACGAKVFTPISKKERAAIICFSHIDTGGLFRYLTENKVVMTLRRDTIRLSIGIHNNEQDVDRLIELISTFRQC